jgi:uncharacterized RDD family membrane protein YckC
MAMTCPACGQALISGDERCASCGAMVAPALEGALAPDPGSLSPADRGRAEPMRDLPGHRKRERSWKDEVKARVRSRREQKNPGGVPNRGELPLFDDGDADEEPGSEESAEVETPPLAHHASVERDTRTLASGSDEGREWRAPDRSAPDLADMPLHETPVAPRESAPKPPPRTIQPPPDEDPPAGGDEEWRLELEAHPQEPAPLERPAFARERAAAAGLDCALMLGTAAIILHFAGRAARVPVTGLRPAWPWLVGYLALLGLVYAGYFTGTIGQTLGKMVTGLRVVDRAGHPPGFLRAFVRGGLGAVGVALLGLGLVPMLFDPARRALHDRLLRMRVVRR